jgi:hypothetical protein
MKTKIFSFILLTTLLITSCTPENPQPNPTPNPTNSNWKFKLTINGITTRCEGSSLNFNSNFCVAMASGGNFTVTFSLADQTASSYISGSLGTASIQLQYPIIGINPIGLNNWIGSQPWITNFPSLPTGYLMYGYSSTLNGTIVPNSATGNLSLPINITDLGSPGNNDYITFGSPLKGNYSGTIYVRSDPILGGSYDTPVNIDLDFVALRP